jgi:hypothetical protein
MVRHYDSNRDAEPRECPELGPISGIGVEMGYDYRAHMVMGYWLLVIGNGRNGHRIPWTHGVAHSP